MVLSLSLSLSLEYHEDLQVFIITKNMLHNNIYINLKCVYLRKLLTGDK